MSSESMSDVSVSVQGLGKRYRIAHEREPYSRLTEALWNTIRHPFRRAADTAEFWALRDVSFQVPQGEVVGIIGRNGAGKSTLLKILSRITEPTEGHAVLRGRVSSLLEVGTGFHPELTGRENIYLSGSILGMSRADIGRRFDEIVAFAEVERFLDTPVKRYSSGMQVRLGFAVAAHLEPDILVIDEVLAVGDAAFQRKCLAKMENVARGGRTVLFVSHNMAAVEGLCSSGIVLEHGSIVAQGDAKSAVTNYLAKVGKERAIDIDARMDRQGDGRLRVTRISANLRTGDDSTIRLAYRAASSFGNVEVSLGLFSARGEGAAYLANALVGDDLGQLTQTGELVCTVPRLSLQPGTYTVNVYCMINGVLADWVIDAARVEVLEGDFFGTGRSVPHGYGHSLMPHAWTFESG